MAVDAMSSSLGLAANAAASAQLRARMSTEEQQSALKVDSSRVQAQRDATASAYRSGKNPTNVDFLAYLKEGDSYGAKQGQTPA